MSEPVGWVVIARDTVATNQISIRGIMDAGTIADESVALEMVRSQLPGAEELFRMAAFGMMPRKEERISKQNLAKALHALGLPAINLDHTYNEIADHIISLTRQMKRSN